MSLLDQLERKFGKFYLPNLLPILLMGQVLVYMALLARAVEPEQLMLHGLLALRGEVWRLFTFMVVPMSMDPLWFLIGLYVTWLMGSALLNQWGEFRFCLFLGTAWFLTVAATLLFPVAVGLVSNFFIMGLLTLAFAKLFPEVEFLIFFIIPVKVKYIGWLTWGVYGLAFFTGDWPERLQILAAMGTWVLFFGPEMVMSLQNRKRRQRFQKEAKRVEGTPFHTCVICGKTDLSHPHADFRYEDGKCYCAEYLQKGSCNENEPPEK
ncbi:MAG: hypothetical protein JJU29_13625 [Verrucomicrobia bacterium]|nr:hypothetical protein [Verrucomicrobiota bacterium]MCH8510650.1 rhomboid family intramembrane serine protease [Kiritimatiellia bacterium]